MALCMCVYVFESGLGVKSFLTAAGARGYICIQYLLIEYNTIMLHDTAGYSVPPSSIILASFQQDDKIL